MISVDWGNQDETIIVWKFNGHWDATCFRHAVKKTMRMAKSKPYPVHGMVDMHRALTAPRDMMTLIRQAIRSNTATNYGKWVVISESQLWVNMWQMTHRLYRLKPRKIHFVSSVQEAYEILEEHIES